MTQKQKTDVMLNGDQHIMRIARMDWDEAELAFQSLGEHLRFVDPEVDHDVYFVLRILRAAARVRLMVLNFQNN